MRGVKTGVPGEFVYGAPPGAEDWIGGLHCTREVEPVGGDEGSTRYHVIYSVWMPSDGERAAIAAGANIRLGIVGEPIPPVSVGITDLKERA